MEELSKSKIKNNANWGGINLSGINFNSFSSSPGWVGYFKGLADPRVIKQASRLIEEFFNINDSFMISALSYDKEHDIFEINPEDPNDCRDSLKNELFADAYHKAIKYGFLQEFKGVYEKFLDEEMQLPIRDIDLPAYILRLDFDSSVFLEFCEVLMAYYFSPIIGQRCFLIDPKLGIALYPHDDRGYGCISLNNIAEEKVLLVDFLKFCGQNEAFEVFIKQAG